MGRMLDALKQIEGQEGEQSADAAPVDKTVDEPKAEVGFEPHGELADGPEAELNFPDEILTDTAELLDELEKAESGVESLVEEQHSAVKPSPAQLSLEQSPEEPLAAEETSPAAIPADESRAKPWSRDSRHVDLATNILTQLPVEGPVSLLFAAADSSGVFAPSLVPLFSTLAERVDGRTLVVECDHRHAALARRFSVEPQVGLADVLSARSTWTEAVCKSEQAGLDVLCSRALRNGDAGNGVVGNGTEQSPQDGAPSMLGEKGSAAWSTFETILAEMHEQYRLVLLENVSATNREMAQLAALCHGAYLLLRMDQTPRSVARKSVKMVNNGGGQLLGCVLLDP